MVFSSGIFLFLFLPVLWAFYYNPIYKKREFRNATLFLASLFFYAWGEPVFVVIMLLSVVMNYLLALWIEKAKGKNHRKGLLVVDILWNLGLLFVYKYLGFICSNLGLLFHGDDSYYRVEIALPIGISFFTFQILSYVADVYRKEVEAEKNMLHVGLYITMFPQLVAGPIVRYQTIADEIVNRKENFEDFSVGCMRFVVGLGKKVLIANIVGELADYIWQLDERTVLIAWMGAIAYTMQIYFDFSGYSDMAIGLGRMFGFHFEENFNYPYVSKSITEFWRRWHMSLSQWFRDYVYIPLGGNRAGKMRTFWNLFVVWLLTGIWHGANWTFICWGLLYFLLLMFEKSIGVNVKKGISHVYTMFFVILAWVLFRSNSITEAVGYWGNMFGIGTSGLIDPTTITLFRSYILVWPVVAIGCTSLPKKVAQWIRKKQEELYSVLLVLGTVSIFMLSVVYLVKNTYNAFIYFNF